VIPPTEQPNDPAISAAINADRKRRAAASGMDSTLLTGAAGLAAPTTATKTLLGS
jgi:hypothetical protein